MEKINNWINKNVFKITTLFILLQPIFDLITSITTRSFLSTVSIGIITKMLFMLFAIYSMIFVFRNKKKSIIYFLFVIVYILIFSLYNLFSVNFNNLIYNLINLFKFWYFPITLVFMFCLFKEKDKIIDKNILVKIFFIYVILIVIPIIFGIGFNSYLEGKVGSSGLFYSASDISAIIGILIPFVLDYIFNLKNKFMSLILFVFVSILCLFIGTKVPIICLLLSLLYFFLKYLSKINLIKRIIILLSAIIVFGLVSIIFIPKTNFYKNINIHLNFLGIESVGELLTDTNNIDRFIYSDRITFLENIKQSYDNSNIIEKFIGVGFVRENENVDTNKKLIEIDYYDVFYANGIMGFIIYFFPFIVLLFNIVKRWFKNKHIKDTGIYLISLILIILMSGFSGHVLTSPSVSIIAAIIIASTYKIYFDGNYKKRILFCANDLRIGGIEKALITLLKNIDYNKYDVDLMLETKSGELLNEVPVCVNIIEYNTSCNKNILVRKISNILKRIKFVFNNYMTYDASICYATYSYPGNVLSKLASKNCSLFIHSNYTQIYKDIEEFKYFFNSRKINKYRKIIFVSNEAKDDFINVYKNLKNKCIVINNLVDYKAIIKKSNEKIDYIKSNKTTFVFVGRLEEEAKKVSRLINVFNELKDVELLIIGDGEEKEKYEKLIKNKNIKLLGLKLNPYPYMKIADYIILTSDYEGFPLVYPESIVLNKKIITTIDVSDDEISIPNRFGYIVSKNEKTMIKQIKDIVVNDNLKLEKLDFNKLNTNRMRNLEKIFDEVI
ncbi:MAG: O-antigen ligase family protein [Bacilli bacterium]|nr:O-antigen ligase family protein [Bacilli bacterium]